MSSFPAASVLSRPKTKYLPYLDGLRGIAILGVVADHLKVPLPPLFHIGPVGVRFFFLLSGYFITLSLWRVRDAAADSPEDRAFHIGRFYFSRLLRVGPPYYLALLAGLVFGIREVHDHFFWLATFQANTYITHLGYWPGAISCFWSLAVQEQFYILWPLVILTVPKRHFISVMSIIILFALGFRVICIIGGATEVTRWVNLFGCLDSFAVGALVAYLKENKLLEKIPSLPRNVLRWAPPFALACYFLARLMTSLSQQNASLALIELLDCFFLAWLLTAALIGMKSRCVRFLGWSPLVKLGRISYGVYVYHVFIIIIFSPFLADNRLGVVGRDLVLFAITLGIASLSWHFIEQPIIAWKNNLGRVPRPLAPKSGPAFA